MRLGEGGVVDDRGGIEEHEVGEVAALEESAALQAEVGSR